MDLMKIYSPVCNMKAIVLKPISLLVKTSKGRCFGDTNIPGVVRKRILETLISAFGLQPYEGSKRN